MFGIKRDGCSFGQREKNFTNHARGKKVAASAVTRPGISELRPLIFRGI